MMTNTNPNQELLDYAIENIEEWGDTYTHLSGDSSGFPFLFTGGELRWLEVQDMNAPKFNTYQTITKQEWLEGRANKASEEPKKPSFTKDMLVAGKHIVEDYSGSFYLVGPDNYLYGVKGTQSFQYWRGYTNDLLFGEPENDPDFHEMSIVKVHEICGPDLRTKLVWERKSEEKLQLEKKIDSLESELKQLKKELEGM